MTCSRQGPCAFRSSVRETPAPPGTRRRRRPRLLVPAPAPRCSPGCGATGPGVKGTTLHDGLHGRSGALAGPVPGAGDLTRGPQALPAHLPWGQTPRPGVGPRCAPLGRVASGATTLPSGPVSSSALWAHDSPSLPASKTDWGEMAGPRVHYPRRLPLVRLVDPASRQFSRTSPGRLSLGSQLLRPIPGVSSCLSACVDPNAVPAGFGLLISPKHPLPSATA